MKQLAPPEFSTIAVATPSAMTCCDQMIGFAFARLLVNTAAAADRGPRFTTRARSSPPLALRPGRDPGGLEPGGRRHAHGATPSIGSPMVSGRPSAMFADWMAAPAVPLPRLSRALVATARPARSSTASPMRQELDPVVSPTRGC